MTDAVILNVDDYEPNRLLRTRVLLKAGYRVVEARGGREALEWLARESFDLVVLDVQMPGVDGLEVCRHIKADPETANILVLHVSATATTTSSYVIGLENGADGYLTDNTDLDVLLATVRSLLRLRRAERERNAALARLRESEEQLRRANALKDEFLATLSHELRTPMNAIVGWSHMLQRPGLSPENMARGIDAIARNAAAQMQLISDVLDVSRIIAGKMRIEVRPVDLQGVLEAALESIRPAAQARQLDLEFQAQGGVPVLADPDRLQQVFWNLLSNAVKFTKPGGSVSVVLSASESTATVVVRDTGIGIPASFLPHVFERFRQFDSSASRHHTGLGLGLALVRHLVELHGGQITASSAGENQGAEFTVTLPVIPTASPADDDGRTRSTDAAAGAGVQRRLAGRILIVDDDPDSLGILEAFLRHHGASVEVARSADAARESIQVAAPDLIISDIGMPGADGYQLIRWLRTRTGEGGRPIPAIALTGYGGDDDRRRALEAGFHVHLAKPVALDELLRAIESLA